MAVGRNGDLVHLLPTKRRKDLDLEAVNALVDATDPGRGNDQGDSKMDSASEFGKQSLLRFVQSISTD